MVGQAGLGCGGDGCWEEEDGWDGGNASRLSLQTDKHLSHKLDLLQLFLLLSTPLFGDAVIWVLDGLRELKFNIGLGGGGGYLGCSVSETGACCTGGTS